jgi:hypothetical protein
VQAWWTATSISLLPSPSYALLRQKKQNKNKNKQVRGSAPQCHFKPNKRGLCSHCAACRIRLFQLPSKNMILVVMSLWFGGVPGACPTASELRIHFNTLVAIRPPLLVKDPRSAGWTRLQQISLEWSIWGIRQSLLENHAAAQSAHTAYLPDHLWASRASCARPGRCLCPVTPQVRLRAGAAADDRALPPATAGHASSARHQGLLWRHRSHHPMTAAAARLPWGRVRGWKACGGGGRPCAGPTRGRHRPGVCGVLGTNPCRRCLKGRGSECCCREKPRRR